MLVRGLVIVLAALVAAPAAQQPARGRRVVIGYVFTPNAVLDPASIAAHKLTHINYAFANLRDGRVVEGFTHDPENLARLTGLRRSHPHLKVLVAAGGWTWSGGFSDAALTEASRARFVESAVDFVRRHDLDGFDVDWEYPGLRGNDNVHRPEDRENFTALMAALRAALDKEGGARGRRYLLTFAAGAFPAFIEHTELANVQASVDFVNLMTYDFRVAAVDAVAGHHANLHDHPADEKQRSADRAARQFVAGRRAGEQAGTRRAVLRACLERRGA
jgi:chitinase